MKKILGIAVGLVPAIITLIIAIFEKPLFRETDLGTALAIVFILIPLLFIAEIILMVYFFKKDKLLFWGILIGVCVSALWYLKTFFVFF